VAKVIQLTVQTRADLAGIQAVQKAIQGLGQATSKTSAGGGASAAKPFKDTGDAALKAERDVLRYASSLAAVQKAQGNAAGAAQTWKMALASITPNTIEANRATTQLIQSQNALSKSAQQAAGGMAVLPRTIAGISHEMASFAAQSLSLGAALSVASATVNSFADAFKFKAELDATTLAINAQLTGVRSQAQVWSEASAFAQKFKLTQKETTDAISASIGVMRASKAPIEDILGVLARMQVLSPEQSLQEAAIALKALASGDTTSLVTRFEVGRDVANQMKQEIQGGADAVAVMGKFLGDTGIGMDVLTTKTQGAAGALKDLAIAQENLKLAQAEFAQGPGMVVLEGQIRTTSGATRALSGDWESMRGSINTTISEALAGMAEWNPLANAVAGAIGTMTGATAFQTDQQQQQTAATLAGKTAFDAYVQAATASTAAQQTATSALVEDITKKLEAEAQTKKLTDAQSLLASIGAAVAAGQMTAGQGALNFAAMTGVAITQARILIGLQAQLAGGKGGVTEGRLERDTPQDRALARVAGAAAQRERDEATKTARVQQTLAVGTTQQKIAEYQKQYDAAVRTHGAESAEAINAQTKLLQATEKGNKAAGTARTSAATAAGAKLEGIEQKTGDKLAQIVADTQAKLVAIDQKAADERAKIAADLANKIATSAADRRAANEADDLDLIGVADAEAAAKLNDRERAQAAAREREVAAAKEAQDAIANGEAESASKVYDIREKQISDQQALDEKYAERQRELSGDEKNLDALKTQYDEATRANEEAAQRRIDIAKAEAEQKKAEVQAEKDAVIAAANDQANQVVSAAERSAAGVTKATSAARASSVANLKAIGDAVTAIPSQKTITITVNQQGTVGASSGGGGGGGTKAAGGGTFIASTPMQITVGDAPSPELVTVTPLGRAGQTRVGPGWAEMAGGGAVIDAGGGYTTPVAGNPPAKPGKGKGKADTPAPANAEAIRKAIKESIEIITLQNDLRKVQAEAARLRPAPINYAWVEGLAIESQEITRIVTSKLLPLKKDEAEAFSKYASATGQAADILKTIADLRTMQAEAKIARPGPIIEGYIVGLANEAKTITQIVRDRLIPGTELEAELYSAYADTVGSSVSILKDIADLRTMQTKAKEERPGPIIEAYITELADEAVRISKIVSARAVPAAEEERDKLSAFADVVGNSVSILKDVSSITRGMFADYASPTDEQLGRLVTDADRVAAAMTVAAARYDTKGLEAAKAYTDALGGTFGVIKDGLLAFEAINSGDFVLDKGKLDQFSAASMQALDVTRALAAKAAAIPAADLSALQTATAAISGQAEAMIKLAAVPWGDLAGANQNYAQSGGAMGGGGAITNYITVNPPPGSSPQQIADMVVRQLNTNMGARR